jgi:nucleoside-diphosphate-sugar epimerase
MKVVITGGAGYVGSVVTAHLLASGMEVTVFDKFVYGGEGVLAHLGRPGFRLVRGDVRRREELRTALEGADAVVHLAGVVGEPACNTDPEAAWATNLGGARETLAAAAECRLERFVFVSTCSNYGVAATNVLADEDSPLKPLSQYAQAKVEAEKLVLASQGISTRVVLRFGTICGVSPRMRFDLLVSEMARSAVRNEPIHVFAPDAWRPFLHVQEAARAVAHVLAGPSKLLDGKVFNVVNENCQKRDLVRLVLKHFPKTCIQITEKQPDLRDYRVSNERFGKQTGFITRHTVEEAFLETARAVAEGWFRDPAWAGHSAIPLAPGSLR